MAAAVRYTFLREVKEYRHLSRSEQVTYIELRGLWMGQQLLLQAEERTIMVPLEHARLVASAGDFDVSHFRTAVPAEFGVALHGLDPLGPDIVYREHPLLTRDRVVLEGLIEPVQRHGSPYREAPIAIDFRVVSGDEGTRIVDLL